MERSAVQVAEHETVIFGVADERQARHFTPTHTCRAGQVVERVQPIVAHALQDASAAVHYARIVEGTRDEKLQTLD